MSDVELLMLALGDPGNMNHKLTKRSDNRFTLLRHNPHYMTGYNKYDSCLITHLTEFGCSLITFDDFPVNFKGVPRYMKK